MPTDAYGNVAHVVGSDVAITARKNPGVLIEHTLNAYDNIALMKWMKATLQINESFRYRDQLNEIAKHDPNLLRTVWKRLQRFYEIVSPLTFKGTSHYGLSEIVNHITVCFKRGIVKYKTIGSQPAPEIIEMLKQEFPLEVSRVKYTLNGTEYISEQDVLIAPVKYILLDKTARDLAGVASAYSQVHGLPAAPDTIARTKHPFKSSAVRLWAEQESPNAAAICGNELLAMAHDMNANPDTHKLIVETILDADQPTNIDVIVDRTKHPYGNTRALQLFNSFTSLGGFGYKYVPEVKK